MNRIIKFRAWDKKGKRMVYKNFSLNARGGISWCLWEEKENIIPMQWTGLKDKNGKEIYESDILKVNETAHELTAKLQGREDLENWDYIGVVEYDTEGADFQITPRKDSIRGFTTNQIREVIGNVFENPELLDLGGKE